LIVIRAIKNYNYLNIFDYPHLYFGIVFIVCQCLMKNKTRATTIRFASGWKKFPYWIARVRYAPPRNDVCRLAIASAPRCYVWRVDVGTKQALCLLADIAGELVDERDEGFNA
jgi:hypothetical protein